MATQTPVLTQISTRVDEEMLRRLDEKCDAEKRSRSFVLGEALEAHLDQYRQPTPEEAV